MNSIPYQICSTSTRPICSAAAYNTLSSCYHSTPFKPSATPNGPLTLQSAVVSGPCPRLHRRSSEPASWRTAVLETTSTLHRRHRIDSNCDSAPKLILCYVVQTGRLSQHWPWRSRMLTECYFCYVPVTPKRAISNTLVETLGNISSVRKRKPLFYKSFPILAQHLLYLFKSLAHNNKNNSATEHAAINKNNKRCAVGSRQ